MQKYFFLLLLLFPAFSHGQQPVSDSNFIFWNKERPLQLNDFKIKVGRISNSYSFAQYSMDYKIGGALAFGLPKDYKRKIRNYFIKSASWIDTSYNVEASIRYQQTLFNLAEVYTREFRKNIYEYRKKIAWGKVKPEDLNSQSVTNFSNRRVQYDTATNFGTIADKQKAWEIIIEKELDDSKEFAAD